MAGGPLNIARKSIGLRGGIGARHIGKPAPTFDGPSAASFSPGSYNWSAPVAGYWKFVAWGAGFGGGSNGGSSGALALITRFLTPAQGVAIVVGARATSGAGADTTLTFQDGKVVTAGGATGQNGTGAGVATGGDVNIAGNVGASVAGASAPSSGLYLGGTVAAASGSQGGSPGAGGSQAGLGGDGLALAVFVKS